MSGLIRVFIEDQYLGFNYNTAKELTLVTGKLMGACEILGIKCERMNVATWKSRVGLIGKDKKKERLIARANEICPVIDEDEAAAVLIGYVAVLDRGGSSMLKCNQE
jgi:hypothetical protein